MSTNRSAGMDAFEVEVRSAWRVVVLPTLVFLGVWIAVPVLARILGARGTAAMLGSAGLGLVLALAASVGLHRVFGQGPGRRLRVTLESGAIRWGRQELQLGAPHGAVLRLDSRSPVPAASLEVQGGRRRVSFFARPVDPQAVDRAFPAAGFALEGALGPDQGMPAWGVPEEAFCRVLEEAWRHRDRNRAFLLHERLPWARPVPVGAAEVRTLPFASPEVQAELAQALYELKAGEIWVTPGFLVLREGHQARLFPLGRHRIEPVDMADSALRWYRIGEASFWLDPGDDAAEVERVLRFVNSRRSGA